MNDDLTVHKKRQRKLKTFAHVDPTQFIHPWDAKALATLRKVPGLDTLTKKILELGLERVFRLENLAGNLQVSTKTYPAVHRCTQWAAKILGVPPPPVFINLSEDYVVMTVGHTQPFIQLSSSMVELFDEEELFFMIAHEIGHIRCEHVLYGVVAQNIKSVLEAVGRATLGLGNLVGSGLALPLLDWFRKAKLSADRAALMCVQDPEVAVRTFMKLAGGGHQVGTQLDRGDFLAQAKAYEDSDHSDLDRAYKLYITAFRTHPYPIMRAKHLIEWVQSGQYTEITGLEVEHADFAPPASSSSQ